jgi:hypothetical protein
MEEMFFGNGIRGLEQDYNTKLKPLIYKLAA